MREAIVCVDDEAILTLCMKHDLMTHYGNRFVYETAGSADEAIAVIEELLGEGVRIAIVISDWLMPGARGDELLAEVQRRCSGVASILVSGQVDDAAIERMRKELALFGFVEKPWRPQRLFAEIDRHAAAAG
jgi:DNA-binding NtrC family response regulator